MKNVDEVAVIDLGRPSSTQSQIGLDEPDAPYIKCGSALMPGVKQLLYQRPVERPITRFGSAVWNANEDP